MSDTSSRLTTPVRTTDGKKKVPWKVVNIRSCGSEEYLKQPQLMVEDKNEKSEVRLVYAKSLSRLPSKKKAYAHMIDRSSVKRLKK